MANGTKVFNHEGDQIFPESNATCINVLDTTLTTVGGTVEHCLLDIYDKITDISEEGNAGKNLNVKASYLLSDSKDEAYIREQTNWGAFQMPTPDAPYLWKKTTFFYGELEIKSIYEISLLYPENEVHTVYKAYADPDKEQPEIFYEQNEEGIDYQSPILAEHQWFDTPVSISAEKPYVYTANRKRVDGKWTKFSDPALLSKWTFDSIIETRFGISSSATAPSIDRSAQNPGSDWVSANTSAFTGYLWMITATKINDKYYEDGSGIIWSNPSLISIA